MKAFKIMPSDGEILKYFAPQSVPKQVLTGAVFVAIICRLFCGLKGIANEF